MPESSSDLLLNGPKWAVQEKVSEEGVGALVS
jgi:hypothetical protein